MRLIIVLKYEDITSKPMEMAKVMGNFLGMKVHEAKIPTFEELHKQRPKIFRSGNNEKWRDEFTEVDLIQFWLMNFDVMKKYSYGEDITEDINISDISNIENNPIIQMIQQLTKVSFFKSPVQKLRIYKKLIAYYHLIKRK